MFLLLSISLFYTVNEQLKNACVATRVGFHSHIVNSSLAMVTP